MHIHKHVHKKNKSESLLKPPLSTQTGSGFVLLHKGEEVGEHLTEKKEEVIYIIQGEALVTIEDEKEYLEAGSLLYIPPHKKHNLKNESDEDLRYMYVVSHFK
ncbi:MAG: cupin domain-containing protein [Patescibacteria group bacterium]